MKRDTLRKASKWAISMTILAGLAYSILALTKEPSYAASCNCPENYLDAEEYCQQTTGHSAVGQFVCTPTSGFYRFTCVWNDLENYVPCDGNG